MVLVVIDCQPRYLPFGPVLEAIEREVRHARANRIPIVFLEYFTAEPTYEHIMELVHGYDLFEVARKRTFGGANEVIAACVRRGWSLEKARHVGAETYCCVAETVEGFVMVLPGCQQEVVADGCYDRVVGGPFPRNEEIKWVRSVPPELDKAA